jgi:hypothetical protein
VTHKSSHVINIVGPIFSDPEVRDALELQTCTKVDAILQKTELSRRDLRCLSRAIDDWLMHVDGEDDA